MIEIQTSTNLSVPRVAVCHAGNICLYLPADWDVNDALAFCESGLLGTLHSRFKVLFAERDFPRIFGMVDDRLSIKPDDSQLPNHNTFFEGFLET